MDARRSSIKNLVSDLTGPMAVKTGLSVGDRLVYSGSNFLTMVIVGRLAGLEDLGVFALAWTVLLAVNVIQEAFVLSPLTVAFGRFRDDGEQRTYAGTALIFQMSLAAAIMVLVATAAAVLSALQISAIPQSVAWCLVAAVPAVSAREFIRKFLFVRLAADRVLGLDAVVAALQIFCLGLLAIFGVLSPATALLAVATASGLCAASWFILNHGRFSVPGRSVVAAELKNHWSFGRWVCAGQMSDLAVTHGVTWLIAILAGTAATGLFAACNSLVMVVNPLLLGIGSILLPRAAQANHEHGRSEVNRLVWKATALLALTVGLLSLATALLGELLVVALYAPASPVGIQAVVMVLVLANFIGATSFAIDNGLLAVNRPDVNLAASLVGLVVTCIVGLVLIGPHGALGAAVAVLIGTLLNSLYQFVAFVRLVGHPVLFGGREA